MTRRVVGRIGLAAVLGAVLTGAAGEAQQPVPKNAKINPDRWRAWAVTEGKDTRLVVEGVVDGGPGAVAVLTPANPQGFDPKILLLNLEYATLPGRWPAIAHPIPAHYTVAPYKKGTHDRVTIRYPDGSVAVANPVTDTGAGPKGR
jgi:hypothetical protein